MPISRDEPIVVSPEPPLDVQNALENLAGDQRLLRDVLASFVDHVPRTLGALDAAAQGADLCRIEAVTHSIKGAAANICAEPVRRRAQSLEELARSGNPKDVAAAVTGLAHDISRLKDYIEGLMPTLTGAEAEPHTGHEATEDGNPAVAQSARIPLKVLNLEESRAPNRILIVDDNPTIVAGLERALEKSGYEVLVADDGLLAVDIAVKEQPELILLDMRLPKLSGVEVCRILKSNESTQSIPVIFVTGMSESERIVDAFAVGGCDYVTKPFRVDEILARVAVHVQLRQAQRELARKNLQLKFLAKQLADINQELGHEARLDPLTQLLNRRAWERSVLVEHERAVRYERGYSIAMVDVDHFKLFNDRLGHPAGDDCLRHIASTLTSVCREANLVGRYGGEEFIVLAPETDLDAMCQLAERLKKAIWDLAIPHPSRPDGNRVTVSLGVADSSAGGLQQVIQRADDALYTAKQTGRNRVCAANPFGEAITDPLPTPVAPAHALASDTGFDVPLRVLVVDDDASNCALCKEILERKGYEVVEALDGVSAFAAIAVRQPDVIIMDVMMPGMNGLECTKRLREDPATREIPIIIVSARAKEEDILAGLEAGANEYITKPYRAAELKLRVRTMAKLNRARLELAQRNEEITKSNEVRGEQAHALGILFDLSRGLAGATSRDAILQQTVVAAAQLLQCRRISVMLPDQRGAYLTIAESIGVDEQLAADIRIPVGGAIAGQVFRSGQAVVVNSVEEEAGSGERYDSDFFVSAPLVSTALRAADQVIGVLNVTNRVDAHLFTEQDLEYLDLVCNLAGSTISELRSRSSREAALDATVIALAALAEYRDSATGRHLDRVTQYALLLARDLAATGPSHDSIDHEFLDALKRAMPLHDIGKVAVPDAILLKPAKLTAAEMETMKQHAEQGARVIRTMIERAPDMAFLGMAEEIAFGHHEWYDGTGYPRGVAGDNIPFVARIAAVADVYDALTTKRVYKGPFPHDRAVVIIKNECGTHFDPEVVKAFLRCEPELADLAHELKDRTDTEGAHSPESRQTVAAT